MDDRRLSADEVARFHRDGYLLKPALFDAEEVALIRRALASDEGFRDRRNTMAMRDAEGSVTTTVLWTDPGDDLFGAIARCERVVGGAERLLGGEVYHYHSKLTLKAPETGGAWNWHQDYGYWYKNGLLFPNLASVAIAVSELTEANGTMRVLSGSHRCGRLEHAIMGGQNGADVGRVETLMQQLEEVSFIAEPGDACFFHCNTLHTSAPNVSAGNRDLLLCCYNRADNNPAIRHHHPFYTPLELVDDGALVRTGLWSVGFERSFMDPATDISIGDFEVDPLT